MIRRPLPLLLPLALALLAGCQDRDLPTASSPAGPDRLIISSPNFFSQISAGTFHTCALRSDSAVECWGLNDHGRATPPSGTFTQVSAGGTHTCALRSDGAVECWGLNVDGQATPPAGTFTQVSAGGRHTCALRSDGTVACRGWNSYAQAPASKTATTGTFTQVSAGWSHTCALRSDGAVECWGFNADGEHAPPSGTFTQVSAGLFHTCALRSNSAVECWGLNDDGQTVPPVGTFAQISAGGYHTCALRSDGAVQCWGLNVDGQATPLAGTFPQISAGGYHTCALRSDSVVECWGDNDRGQAPASRSATPYTMRINPTATFSAAPLPVVAGESLTLALTDAQVPGWPGPVTFTYAFDCGDGSGYGTFGYANTTSCPTSAAGTRTVKGTVRDWHGDETEYTAAVEVLAFAPPVVNPNGTLNKPTGAAVISGTLTCSAPTAVPLSVSLTQEQTKGKSMTTVTGSGGTTVNCNGSTAWSVTVSPASGKFAAGAAAAEVSATGTSTVIQTVQLR